MIVTMKAMPIYQQRIKERREIAEFDKIKGGVEIGKDMCELIWLFFIISMNLATEDSNTHAFKPSLANSLQRAVTLI